MTNFEKYKDDLMKINGRFGVSKTQQKIVPCACFGCKNCEFNEGCCESAKIKWLCEEWTLPVLSDSELELMRIICKITNKKYKYIIRTESGGISFFVDKPTVSENDFGRYCSSKSGYFSILDSDKILFQNIQYEDGLYDIENKTFIK